MNKLPPCDHDCCPPTHCELDRLKAENARLAAAFENIERMVQRWGDCQATYDQLIVEFARLRAAMREK